MRNYWSRDREGTMRGVSVRLDVELQGPLGGITAEVASRTLLDVDALLKSLDRERRGAAEGESDVQWTFTRLAVGSVKATMEPITSSFEDRPQKAALSLVRGLSEAESAEVLPDDWDETSIRIARRMAGRLGDHERGLSLIARDGRILEEGHITRRTARNLRVADKTVSESIGSISGSLGTLSVRGQGKLSAGVWLDRGPRVTVKFAEDMLSTMKDALGRRVTISGRLYRNSRDQIVRVHMKRLDLLESTQPLSDLWALDPGIAGYRDVTQHLGVIRG